MEASQPTTSVPRSESKKQEKSTRRKARQRNTSEHYDALLRRLQLVDSDWIGEAPCALGVTSCQAREGVTTVAANLAVAAANALGRPVLLVDANVLNPSLHNVFKVRMSDGLISAARGDSDVFASTVESGIENLSILPAGTPQAGREPVYELGKLEEVLDNLKHVFPLLVFDLPPANEFTTCFALSRMMDGVLLVIEAARVDRADAERAKNRLCEAKSNLLGVVFNKQ